MAIARRQAAGSGHGTTGGFGAQAVALPNAVQAGSLLVCLYWGNSNTGNATCADNINGAWTALTQQTPVSGSGRRMNWFYKLNSASATAGSLTVTVSPNANAGNSEWIQVAEYSGVASYDSAVSSYAIHSTGTTVTQTSGVPTQTGDLVLMGFATDNEGNKTFSANAPMTAVVLDASSKTAGQTNGSASLGFVELLGATTSAVAGSMGIGTSDDGGKWIIGFAPTTGSNLTKTQAATARIAENLTKTQPATARVAENLTKTQPAVAQVATNNTKTQTALSRIAKTFSKTQPATAAVGISATKTQPAVARIAIKNTKTQPAVARIATARSRAQSAVASVVFTVHFQALKTQPATATITSYYFTPPVVANVPPTYTRSKDPYLPVSNISQRLFRFFSPRANGVSVIKTNGVFTATEYPQQSAIEDADVVYLGGHTYRISGSEAAALTGAGFAVETK